MVANTMARMVRTDLLVFRQIFLQAILISIDTDIYLSGFFSEERVNKSAGR